uniref:glycosyltransferase family 87 protein n=1 Tax=Cephaloticoccus sp. TaxID=1985742 RepID=UPI00404B7D11
MNISEHTTRQHPTIADWAVRALFFAILVLVTFSFPHPPANELDASWRMVLAKVFQDGRQFGTEVVFTYGPLGFLMGKTYAGLHYNSLLVWQCFQSVIFSLLIFRNGLRLEGYGRYGYFAFFILLGVTYDDAMHQMVIAMVGFELIRRNDEELRILPMLSAILFGVLGLIKFTNLLLGGIFVASTVGLHLWNRRYRAAIWLSGWSIGTFLIGWILCGQNLLNLPAYFYNSWEISQGYQETMGVPTPQAGFIIGLITVGFIVLYAINFLRFLPDRARAIATFLALSAFLFLNWKHGFVRADGHMIGFFYAVLVPATTFPWLLMDASKHRVLQGNLALITALCAFTGIGIAIPGLYRGLLSNPQERVYNNVTKASDLAQTRKQYDHLLDVEKDYFDLPQTKAVVGNGTLDVLGYEQAVAIYNGFNYRPRPVFQSYSAYRPHLARINRDYYASDQAPDFVLVKLQTIDRRLMTFDDSEVLALLLYRYEYVLSEKDLHLWRRKPGAFDVKSIEPKLLRTTVLVPNQPCILEELSDRPLWAQVTLRPSLLGYLRNIFYKLPIVDLQLLNNQKMVTEYRMPLPQGRTGFILNPVVEDYTQYMNFASDKPERLIRSITLKIAPEDRKYFADEYTVKISELPRSHAGDEFFKQSDKRVFSMFDVTPIDYVTKAPLSEGVIDGRRVMVFHAPSDLTLRVPRGASTCSGAFGYLDSAYSNGNTTDGATFTISWVLGSDEILLMERTLEPLIREKDRGLQFFKVTLPPGRDGGHLRLHISAGPRNNFAWDWTAWTGLNIY